MRMPFGKYGPKAGKKGVKIHKLPTWYLTWLAENIKENTPRNKKICLQADKELQFRMDNPDTTRDRTEPEYQRAPAFTLNE